MSFANFREFYPYYLKEHKNKMCRLLHFVGTTLVLVTLVWATCNGVWWVLWCCPLFGYGFAWLGHFVFEKNRPATFRNPIYSLVGDFVMYFDVLKGKISIF